MSKRGFAPGKTGGSGLGQASGWWRPQKSSGHIAIPEGPQEPLPPRQATLPDGSGRLRDPKTAANIAELDAALAPRRWRPS